MATLAEKLATIEANVPKVYNAGYEKGKSEGGGYYDTFWDSFQMNGEQPIYSQAFSSGTTSFELPTGGGGSYRVECSHWNDVTFKPKYDIKPKMALNMFEYCGITDLCKILDEQGVVLDFSELSTAQNMFNYCFRGACWMTSIPPIDLVNVANMTGNFSGCISLKSLELNNLKSTVPFIVPFDNCLSLENLDITGTIGQNGFDVKKCTVLSHDSLLNILNILEDKTDDTSGTTWKVSLGSTNISKLTETELDIAYQKGWTVV